MTEIPFCRVMPDPLARRLCRKECALSCRTDGALLCRIPGFAGSYRGVAQRLEARSTSVANRAACGCFHLARKENGNATQCGQVPWQSPPCCRERWRRAPRSDCPPEGTRTPDMARATPCRHRTDARARPIEDYGCRRLEMAPVVGLEPTTCGLTVRRATTDNPFIINLPQSLSAVCFRFLSGPWPLSRPFSNSRNTRKPFAIHLAIYAGSVRQACRPPNGPCTP